MLHFQTPNICLSPVRQLLSWKPSVWIIDSACPEDKQASSLISLWALICTCRCNLNYHPHAVLPMV